MSLNLDPVEALTAFHHQLSKGKIVRIPDNSKGEKLSAHVLEFQYNPETITRTRTGEWDPRNRKVKGGKTSSQRMRSASGQGSASLRAGSETIAMKIVFDATEAILAGQLSDAAEEGVSQYLAALELIPIGIDPKKKKGKGKKKDAINPVKPDQMLLVLGERYYPVVITSLTITEQKYSPKLVPIRAEVDIKMNVLEATESAYNYWIKKAFNYLVEQRDKKAKSVYEKGSETLTAICNALDPKMQAN